MKKNWYQSKTLWAALLSFLTVAATEIFADPEIADKVEGIAAWLLPAIMGILRLVTTEPVQLKGN